MRKLPLTSQHTVGSDTFDIRQEQRLADDNLTHNLRTGLSWKTSEKSHIDLAYTASFTPSGKGDISATGNYVASDSHIRDDAAMHNLALSASTGFGMQIGADYTHYNTTSRQEMSLLPADGAPSSFRTDAGQCIDASRSRSTRTTTSAGSGRSTTAPASSMSATMTTSIIRRKRR